MLDKSKLKINGVYKFVNTNIPEKGFRECVIPSNDKFPQNHMFLSTLNSGDALFHFDTNMNDVYPTWDRVHSDNIEFHEYLGQYDWGTQEVTPPTITAEKEEICSYLISSFTSEVLDIYETGIFRAKVTKRNEEQWVHFDSKGCFDDGVYGYTKDEFLTIMPMLREIEEKFLKNEEDCD